jgi:cytidylate kinase
VRQILVGQQREWVEAHGGRAVVEGRDIGSVVFPDAEVKVYLDARPEVRARRRALERGDDPDQVGAALAQRDRLDSTREASPLSIPVGAVVIDTSDMGFDEVVGKVVALSRREA